MKILYAIQGTGNGHISRAREIAPLLQQYGELDLLVSGTEAEMALTQPLKYQYHGFSFVFGNKGGVDKWATYKLMNLPKLWKDIHSIPLKQYDLIVNDFEPVTAWACRLQKVESVSLSHQCSFVSPNTPRPEHRSTAAELLLKYYSPTNYHIGFHFDRYADFIHTPVIRSGIRSLDPKNKGHYTVYLPAYDDRTLLKYLSQVDVPWQIFSKRQKTNYTEGNVTVSPVNNEAFNQSMCNCEGLLTGGGFEGPAEALFLGKKVLMIPMKDQYEQQCNAQAASLLGVPVVHDIDDSFVAKLRAWVEESKVITVNFPDETAGIIEGMVKKYARSTAP
ncbi:MAG: glycosyltransferase family protein [Mucilaginibacter sp.]|uniref:glycosyltransferase family protein n=1 Tax=Mucilaginibacter sp. TaxID=1882438 RepID=UPI003263E7A4